MEKKIFVWRVDVEKKIILDDCGYKPDFGVMVKGFEYFQTAFDSAQELACQLGFELWVTNGVNQIFQV